MDAVAEIRVVIADDHEVVRKGVGVCLKMTDDIRLVGEACDGNEAVEACERLKPDIVLMDLVMPHLDGFQAIQQIKAQQPAIRIIALSSYSEQEMAREAIRVGAVSYLLKNVSGEDLAYAIRGAYSGRSTISPEITKEVLSNIELDQIGKDLTKRERTVLALLAEGLKNSEIALRLSISCSTARAHVSNILSKLNVTTRSEAVALALRRRLVK